MNKLLSANFMRIFKDKIFHIGMVLMFLAGVLLPIIHYINMKRSDFAISLEMGFFAYAVFIVILTSVFIALFVGTEYSDGTLRNKIVVGHTRCTVYLSNLIVCLTAGVIMCIAYLLPYLCVGIPLLGFFEVGAKSIILFVMCVFTMMAAFVSLFTLIAMLSQNKAITAVACILLAFLLLLVGIYINSRLNEPEYYDEYSYTENGITVSEEKAPNPNYLAGTKRAVYEFLFDFIPGGQAIQLSVMTAVHLWQMALYDLFILLSTTATGVIIFKRKNLK